MCGKVGIDSIDGYTKLGRHHHHDHHDGSGGRDSSVLVVVVLVVVVLVLLLMLQDRKHKRYHLSSLNTDGEAELVYLVTGSNTFSDKAKIRLTGCNVPTMACTTSRKAAVCT